MTFICSLPYNKRWMVTRAVKYYKGCYTEWLSIPLHYSSMVCKRARWMFLTAVFVSGIFFFFFFFLQHLAHAFCGTEVKINSSNKGIVHLKMKILSLITIINSILTMSLLERVSCVAVYRGSESSSISSKISSFVFWRRTKVLQIWNYLRVSK